MQPGHQASIFERLSPAFLARLTGVLYLVNIVVSLIGLNGKGSHWLLAVCGPAATASYVSVTALLCYLFWPVNRWISLLAASFSWAGSIYGYLNPAYLHLHMDTLVFYGFYCLLISYLIYRSRFLPQAICVVMLIPGLSWMTFLWPPLIHLLAPYQYIAGGIGEATFTIWLLTASVNSRQWKLQAKEQRLSAS